MKLYKGLASEYLPPLLVNNEPMPVEDSLSELEMSFVFPAAVVLACITMAGVVLMMHGCNAQQVVTP